VVSDCLFLSFRLNLLGVIIFGSIRFLSKKVTKPNFFLKKTETESNRLVSVRFFRAKTGSNRFGSVFSGFLSVSVRFGFFGFLFIKPNRTGRFFQKFNRFNQFFFRFGFFGYCFSGFLGLIGFPVFLLTPRIYYNNYFNHF